MCLLQYIHLCWSLTLFLKIFDISLKVFNTFLKYIDIILDGPEHILEFLYLSEKNFKIFFRLLYIPSIYHHLSSFLPVKE